jgi:PhnB protein
MPTLPYLHFQGQCAEALAFYATVFNGSGLQTMRYADGPEAPPAWKDSPRIMHGQVSIYDGTLMASDYPPGTDGSPQQGFSVMQSAPNPAEAQRVFTALADQGAVIQPFQPTFFSPGFGMVEDKFGTHWIISALPATA